MSALKTIPKTNDAGIEKLILKLKAGKVARYTNEYTREVIKNKSLGFASIAKEEKNQSIYYVKKSLMNKLIEIFNLNEQVLKRNKGNRTWCDKCQDKNGKTQSCACSCASANDEKILEEYTLTENQVRLLEEKAEVLKRNSVKVYAELLCDGSRETFTCRECGGTYSTEDEYYCVNCGASVCYYCACNLGRLGGNLTICSECN